LFHPERFPGISATILSVQQNFSGSSGNSV
jgi:hypothetical protein